jgi:hypothetical protein
MKRPLRTVAVEGDGLLADALRATLAAQDDLAIVEGAAAARVKATADTVTGTVSATGGPTIGPLTPDLCALGRVARAIPGVRRIDATVLVPPGATADARSGPVNAVRVCPATSVELGEGGVMATVQQFVVPHTLCWVAAADFELDVGLDAPDVLDMLASSRRLLIAPAALHIDDTAELLDVMRDLERGSRWFFETVVFEHSVVCSERQLRLVFAASLGAVAADAVDELRLALTSVRTRAEAERRSDRALAVLERLADGNVPKRATELAET